MVTEKAKEDYAEREAWAFQYIADIAKKPWGHDATISILEPNTLQGTIVRQAARTSVAQTPEDFRKLMKDPDVFVIFLPQDAMIVKETIDRVCAETPLDKTIIWETDNPS